MRKRGPSINWTSRDVLTLVNEEIENSPNNLRRAFENIADRMDTSVNNVAKAWYRNLKFNIKGFTVKSRNIKVVNTKNEKRMKAAATPIHESVVSTQNFDGMRVVTIKQYYVA